MSSLAGPGLMIAALLALAGAQKVLDPSMTVGALRSMRLPFSPALVRAGAGAEVAIGVSAVAVGGPVTWGLVVASYLAFTAFVLAALKRGTMLGSCGCFGREDTPPHWTHLALNLGAAMVAGGVAATGSGPLFDGSEGEPVRAIGVAALATVGVYVLHAAYVDLPRTLVARHQR